MYNDLAPKLQEQFPEGTVKVISKNKAHIPVQAYMKRLEDVAKGNWHWSIMDMPQLDTNVGIVFVKGELTILDTKRQGIGVGKFKTPESGLIKVATATAESEAFRDACDKFLMGWKDLAKYREWGTNPGVTGVSKPATTGNENAVEIRNCLRCKKPLTLQDEAFLNIQDIKLNYCSEHVPKHFLKNK